MSDVSSNENIIDQEDLEDQEDVSGNDSFNPNYEYEGEFVSEPQTATLDNSFDYSSHFENIESLLKFNIAVVIGFLLLVGFIVGWKHD